MAEAPVKDVFDDDGTDLDDDQRVVDEAEAAEEHEGTRAAAEGAGGDDIEVVLAEEEKAAEEGEPAEPTDDSLALVEESKTAEVNDDLEQYSKAVRKRIEREIRLRERERNEAQNAIAAERGKRIDAERKSLSAHKNLTSVLLVNIDSQLKTKAAELKYLLGGTDADGNPIENVAGKQVDVQGELDDLRAKKREIESAKVSIEQQAEQFERQVTAPPQSPQVTEATKSWLETNKWFTRKGFAAETLLVRELDNKLATERSDKGSPDYFRELNRRIRAEMPDLTDKVRRAFKPASRVSSAVAPVSRTASARGDTPSKRRVTLDKQDLQNMRTYGINTSDPKAVLIYAKEKLALEKGTS